MPNRKAKSRKPKNELCHLTELNKADNADNVVEWLKSGELTPKLLKKHLRYTLKDISQGRIARPDEALIWGLTHSYSLNDKSEHKALLKVVSSALSSAVLPRSASPDQRMILGLMMESCLYYNFHRQEALGSVVHVKSSLVDAIKSIRFCILTKDGFADLMATTSRLTLGSFRGVSPVFKLTEGQFIETVYGKVGRVDTEDLWRECELMRRTTNTLVQLVGDYHPMFYTCWECDKVFVSVFHCGNCKAALYCSRKCQGAAWKGGHKDKCDRLKKMHECVLVNVEEVERVHVSGMLDGFELSPQMDSNVLRLCLEYSTKDSGPLEVPMEASMKIFYENLGRVIRGEWWAFHLSDEEKRADNAAPRDKIRPEILKVLQMLTVNWFECARSALGTVDPKRVTAMTDDVFRTKCDTPMSANTLLETYRVVNPVFPYRPRFKQDGYSCLRFAYSVLEAYN